MGLVNSVYDEYMFRKTIERTLNAIEIIFHFKDILTISMSSQNYLECD